MISENIKISEAFKAQTKKAILSIVLFIFTYLILLVLALGLTVLCVYGGIMLVVAYPRLITIAIGIGLASMGILILFFLVKFIFKSHKVDRSHLIEITKKEESQLFELINEVVKEVGTKFPKRVYLSADVNAAVFYDSNFWSMFFPIKKNLQIGLGLVNTISKSELRAILAHEFGHFSQKSMKVGSYVYNVNQVIYNMLYDNDSYQNMMGGWANITGYFAIFVSFATMIIEGIQWLLQKMYGIVNKNYMSLSREMEFHADEIAANVTGYEPLKTSLLRMDLADHAFNSVLGFYSGKIEDNFKSKNVFEEQRYVMHFVAKENNIKIQNDLPEVNIDELNRFNKSKLVIEDQWASHPSTEERIKRLEQTQLVSESVDHSPARSIFENYDRSQQQFTEKLFEGIEEVKSFKSLSIDTFKEEFQKEFSENSFPAFYNKYYDSKNPFPFDLNTVDRTVVADLEELFSDQKIELVYDQIGMEADKESIEQIADKKLLVKTFDYNGKKYKSVDAKKLLSDLEPEFKKLSQRVLQNDKAIYICFLHLEDSKGVEKRLTNLYQQLFDYDITFEDKIQIYHMITEGLQFINYHTEFEQIDANFEALLPLEVKLKKEIKMLMEDFIASREMKPDTKANFEKYLSKEWGYFINQSYLNDNLELLYQSLNDYSHIISRKYFLMKKELLDYQVGLIY